MQKNLTELVFILDKSGSMYHSTKDTIEGFNSMIANQKKEDGAAIVSTILFSNSSQVLHDRKNLNDIPELTERDYVASGMTALMDAIGGAIHHIKNVHKYAREEDLPEHTLFVITTDGMENASREYTADQVRSMITEQEERGWKFVFVAANIDAVQTGKSIGINADCCSRYREGSELSMYYMMDEMVGSYRRTGRIPKDWKKDAKPAADDNK